MAPPGRVDITAADAVGAAPITTIELADDGGAPIAADLHDIAAMALKNDDYVRNNGTAGLVNKVSKTGDTMSGKLDIDTVTVNGNALDATGNGTGLGASITGGATGRGADIQAGGGNNIGAYCVGAGTGAGVSALGGASGVGGQFVGGGGNNSGVVATGAGTAAGITSTGGATGVGGAFVAGGGNAAGLSAVGNGTGAGAALTGGATGPGLTAVNGTAQSATAPTVAAQIAGYIEMTGTDPNSTVNPGANNALHGANIIKSWATISTLYAVQDGYNVASITNVAGNIYKLTFVRPMANTNYGVTIQQHGAPGGAGALNANKNAGDFEFVLYDTSAPGSLGFIVGATHAYIEVVGRQ